MRQALTRDSIALDAVAAALLLAGGTVELLVTDGLEGPLWLDLALLAVLAAAAVWRRRRPILSGYAFLATLACAGLLASSPASLTVPFLGLLLWPYAVGAYARGHAAAAYPPAAVAMVALVDVAGGTVRLGDFLFPSAIAVAAWMVGRASRSRVELAAELHEAALRAEEAREAEARRAVAGERSRIAREMHDVVAHAISVMVVQAGGARRILLRDPERAEDAAAEIERTGREALLEMRRLLGVLRRADQTGQLTPAPSFDGLERLLDDARARGLHVELRVEGRPRQLPAGVGVSAYRMVQEALDHVLDAAPGGRVDVEVGWRAAGLEIAVTFEQARPADPQLIGIRERVALYGGEVETECGVGTCRVTVRLPLQPLTSNDADSPPALAQGAP